jgi:hypothetical protein
MLVVCPADPVGPLMTIFGPRAVPPDVRASSQDAPLNPTLSDVNSSVTLYALLAGMIKSVPGFPESVTVVLPCAVLLQLLTSAPSDRADDRRLGSVRSAYYLVAELINGLILIPRLVLIELKAESRR